MAFQFTKDKSGALMLTLSGDVDLEITPEIKSQLTTRISDVNSLRIDAANVSYIDSSGVSVLIIAMQSCKKRSIPFEILAASDELMRVIQLAKLEKLLPITRQTGPARINAPQMLGGEDDFASEADDFGGLGLNDDDLIADLSGGGLGQPDSASNPPDTSPMDTPPLDGAPQDETPVQPAPEEPTAEPMDTGGSDGIKPGTFG